MYRVRVGNGCPLILPIVYLLYIEHVFISPFADIPRTLFELGIPNRCPLVHFY